MAKFNNDFVESLGNIGNRDQKKKVIKIKTQKQQSIYIYVYLYVIETKNKPRMEQDYGSRNIKRYMELESGL